MRRLNVDASYTVEIGFMDVGYRGNEHLRSCRPLQPLIAYALERNQSKSDG